MAGRLAPSPTGAQHLGNARTYLIAWLSARSQGLPVRLRIEDIDVWRNKPDAVAQALDDLQTLGLDFDGDMVVQSARLDAHLAALDELKRQELVYPCTCSRTDIANAAGAPHAEHEGPAYPGTCASRTVADADALDKPYAWRFRVSHSPVYEDLFRGPTSVDLKSLGGDFVVWRSFHVPAYQLAVVVDDADMGITEVIRGDDLVPSTPRQLLLYEALGRTPPRFGHVPLVVGPDGRRLAKRHGDTRLQTYWKAGVSPQLLLGHLAHSCGWLTEPHPITARDLIPLFRLATIPTQPWTVPQPEPWG
ncbi:MAG: tRNA glutamyl-Q(34) synthetase GluQRS [Fimbriiglobus sp.]